jgi:Holliday junction resolvase RusA-like endonuclease
MAISAEPLVDAGSVDFFVPGTPRTAGSKKAFAHPKTGRIIVTDDAGQAGKDWRSDVRAQATEAMAGRAPFTGPLRLEATFYVVRPRGHYGSGRNVLHVKLSAPRWPTTRPDATKMLRAVEDAMTGLVYQDDAQIVQQMVEKRFAEAGRVGAHVRVALI